MPLPFSKIILPCHRHFSKFNPFFVLFFIFIRMVKYFVKILRKHYNFQKKILRKHYNFSKKTLRYHFFVVFLQLGIDW